MIFLFSFTIRQINVSSLNWISTLVLIHPITASDLRNVFQRTVDRAFADVHFELPDFIRRVHMLYKNGCSLIGGLCSVPLNNIVVYASL